MKNNNLEKLKAFHDMPKNKQIQAKMDEICKDAADMIKTPRFQGYFGSKMPPDIPPVKQMSGTGSKALDIEKMERLMDYERELSNMVFQDFTDQVVKNQVRRDRGIILMYVWVAIAENMTLEQAIKEYEWCETPTPPQADDYREFNSLLEVRVAEFGGTTIRLRKRKYPNYDIDSYSALATAAGVIQKMIEEL